MLKLSQTSLSKAINTILNDTEGQVTLHIDEESFRSDRNIVTLPVSCAYSQYTTGKLVLTRLEAHIRSLQSTTEFDFEYANKLATEDYLGYVRNSMIVTIPVILYGIKSDTLPAQGEYISRKEVYMNRSKANTKLQYAQFNGYVIGTFSTKTVAMRYDKQFGSISINMGNTKNTEIAYNNATNSFTKLDGSVLTTYMIDTGYPAEDQVDNIVASITTSDQRFSNQSRTNIILDTRAVELMLTSMLRLV